MEAKPFTPPAIPDLHWVCIKKDFASARITMPDGRVIHKYERDGWLILKAWIKTWK